jgi:hypothetical protein
VLYVDALSKDAVENESVELKLWPKLVQLVFCDEHDSDGSEEDFDPKSQVQVDVL